jgi:hypothetical protein
MFQSEDVPELSDTKEVDERIYARYLELLPPA